MTLLLSSRFPSVSVASSSPSPSPSLISFSIRRKPICAAISARDRIIDFGKYKGRLLGALPSSYLKWVSRNLRARDFEEWAKLADEVLRDPVYRDRLEWEFAEKVLNGDGSSVASRTGSAVSDLLEISERFGWDNEDEAAWSRIDFALLGTSKGGRIPRNRIGDEEEVGFRFNRNRKTGFTSGGDSGAPRIEQLGYSKNDLGLKKEKDLGFLRRESAVSPKEMNPRRQRGFGHRAKESMVLETEKWVSTSARRVAEEEEEEEGFEAKKTFRTRRKERRERGKLKRGLQMHEGRSEIVESEKEREDGDGGEFGFPGNQNRDRDRTVGNYTPFPGREALLRKVLNRGRVL